MLRSISHRIVIVLVLAGPSLAVPGSARADYHVRACVGAPLSENNSWSIVRTATATSDAVTSFTHCPTTGEADPYGNMQQGFGVLDTLSAEGGANVASDGRYAEQRFTAPAGTRITNADLVRDLGNRSDAWRNYGRIDGVDMSEEWCFRVSPHAFCRVQGRKVYSGLHAQTIAYGLRCGSQWSICINGSILHMAWALISSATVTLDDTVDPIVGSPAATGLADGTWRRGSGQVTFAASDNTGIRVRRLVEGGTVRATKTASGVAAGGCGVRNSGLAYTFTQPCAGERGLNGTQAITVNDVCAWGDGVHTVAAVAEDTDANSSTSAGTATVRVDCTAPSVGIGPVGDDAVAPGAALQPTVDAADAHAGVAATDIEYQLGNGGTWTAYAGPVTPAPYESYRFRARATDAAGNVSGWATTGFIHAVPATTPVPPQDPVEPAPLGTAPIQPGPPAGEPGERNVPRVTPTPTPTAAPTISIRSARVDRRKRRLRISLRATGVTSGTATITVKVGKHRTVTRKVKLRGGRFSGSIALPRRSGRKVRISVRLTLPGATPAVASGSAR